MNSRCLFILGLFISIAHSTGPAEASTSNASGEVSHAASSQVHEESEASLAASKQPAECLAQRQAEEPSVVETATSIAHELEAESPLESTGHQIATLINNKDWEDLRQMLIGLDEQVQEEPHSVLKLSVLGEFSLACYLLLHLNEESLSKVVLSRMQYGVLFYGIKLILSGEGRDEWDLPVKSFFHETAEMLEAVGKTRIHQFAQEASTYPGPIVGSHYLVDVFNYNEGNPIPILTKETILELLLKLRVKIPSQFHETICPICLTDLSLQEEDAIVWPCSHAVCHDCALQLNDQSVRCYTCRALPVTEGFFVKNSAAQHFRAFQNGTEEELHPEAQILMEIFPNLVLEEKMEQAE